MIALSSKSFKTELYRKSVHLSSLWMPMLILSLSRNACIVLFSALLLADLVVEYSAYNKTAVIGNLFRRMFIKTLRNREISREGFVPSGSVYIMMAAVIVSVCFNSLAAAAAMCVMLVADSSAALVGKFCGTFRFYNGKSLEGTAAFFVSAFAVVSCFYADAPLIMVVFVAAMTTAAEFFEKELKVDDNFTIPLVCGFLLNLIA